ncbi:MAG TPA: TetR family transcriptional regulator [Patescibacteria group bacterium]|nr:TetR family transcriptional regulator [Patescibacteria group bacterium]
MAQKRKTDQTKTIVDAALALAGERGWDAVSLADVAKGAKLPLKTVQAAFADSWAIMESALRGLETETRGVVQGHLGDNWRDNLMEILMTRFELAQRHRDAYLAVAPAVMKNPALVRRFGKSFYRTMERMLLLAGAPAGNKCAPLAVAATAALFLSLVHVWRADDTPDLSKTMAAIDKRTGTLEQALDLIRPRH